MQKINLVDALENNSATVLLEGKQYRKIRGRLQIEENARFRDVTAEEAAVFVASMEKVRMRLEEAAELKKKEEEEAKEKPAPERKLIYPAKPSK